MMPDKQWRRIEHRAPSPALRCARVVLHGVAFRATAHELDCGSFIPHVEVDQFFGSVDSYVAHMLWTRCGGCVGMVEEE